MKTSWIVLYLLIVIIAHKIIPLSITVAGNYLLSLMLATVFKKYILKSKPSQAEVKFKWSKAELRQ